MKLLLEGSRDNALAAYLPLFQNRGINISLSQLKQMLLQKFVNEASMNNLSLQSNYYLAGVARYYFNHDLTTNKRLGILDGQSDDFNPEICTRLNALILILRNAYIDTVGKQFEQPEDFGTMKLSALLRKYNKKINEELGINNKPVKKDDTPAIDMNTNAGKNYTYEILYSQEDAQKYKKYTDPGAWCITYAKQHYNAYISRYKIHYVIFRMNGFENVPRKCTEGFSKRKPQDLYGNSLIAVLQSNNSPEPLIITSRWNHGSRVDGTAGTEADRAYTKEEFLKTIGCGEEVLQRCFDQWKANKPKSNTVDRKALNKENLQALRDIKYMQMLLNNGQYEQVLNKLYFKQILIADDNSHKPTTKMEALKYPCVVAYQPDNNTSNYYYYTLLDRKQLYFDKVLYKDNSRYNCVNVEKLLNGVYYIGFGDKCNTFYDAQRHRFLELDNNCKFKYTPYRWSMRDKDVFEVCDSKMERHVLDVSAKRFICAPNGSNVFENIRFNGRSTNSSWDRSVNCQCIPKDAVIECVYDSSARISYFYDVSNKRFMDLSHLQRPDHTIVRLEKFGFNNQNLILIQQCNHNRTYSANYIQICDENMQPLTISGCDVFNEVDIYDNMLFLEVDDKTIGFRGNFDTPIINPLNNSPIFKKKPANLEWNANWVVIPCNDNERSYWRSQCLIYNPYFDEYYHEGDRLLFYLDCGNSGRLILYPDDKHVAPEYKIVLPNAKKYKQQDTDKIVNEAIRRSFYEILERINRY